ncbi:MAG TPA: gluconokinase [Acidimicrobiia bacterium]|nr:gluconokinase [Acidimicrobiia bacterium]
MAEFIVVMGVTGVGKSTIGRRLAAALDLPFLDADDFHSDEAKAKMHAGIPLTDADRAPWLDRMNQAMHAHASTGAVLACSALTDGYRERLTAGLDDVRFVLLTGDPALILGRVETRRGHFAGADLLPSQFATLVPPRDALTIDVSGTPDEITARTLVALRGPGS